MFEIRKARTLNYSPRYRFVPLLIAGLIAAVAPATAIQAFDMEQDQAAKLKAARAKAAADKATTSAAEPRTIYDGVYAAAQAERGKKNFTEFCSSCHGARAGGGPAAPAITGSSLDEKEGGSLFDLFEFMRGAMPPDNPGYLRDREYADVLAYILQLQGAPAGEAELPNSEEGLTAIEIVARH
ncbi:MULTISPECIES: c-type cytochrome [unclassified Haematobacter]|uniref:c-type cytochrome n=1 Tax=unclassified Haematobacter TaxID=2640585 RepID=UPI0025B83E1F|nr:MULTISPECIES: cytochrome c [unclassified Haematobacter]